MNRRHERISALFIDAVLDASRQHGVARAARLLHEDGVPLDVALRVLTRPAGRRQGPRPPHILVAAAAALVRPFGATRPPVRTDHAPSWTRGGTPTAMERHIGLGESGAERRR